MAAKMAPFVDWIESAEHPLHRWVQVVLVDELLTSSVLCCTTGMSPHVEEPVKSEESDSEAAGMPAVVSSLDLTGATIHDPPIESTQRRFALRPRDVALACTTCMYSLNVRSIDDCGAGEEVPPCMEEGSNPKSSHLAWGDDARQRRDELAPRLSWPAQARPIRSTRCPALRRPSSCPTKSRSTSHTSRSTSADRSSSSCTSRRRSTMEEARP